VTFCDTKGDRIPWLQPIDSVGVNGRHAVVIGPGIVSVEVFRVRNTYDVLIVKYDVSQPLESQREACSLDVELEAALAAEAAKQLGEPLLLPDPLEDERGAP